MYAFAYERPASLADTVAKISAGGQALAGGQTLIASLKQRLAQPGSLVDLGGVSELSGIKKEGNTLVIGAMTRHEFVADSAEVKTSIPGLAALAGNIGDRQVRAMGRFKRPSYPICHRSIVPATSLPISPRRRHHRSKGAAGRITSP